ncbi:MAG: hypothetical protein COT73_12735 [Bdellovibrio sp. CG10_big_fil_rev_8_21_14_0_10_47_8]|nr:MAG: hypothetical protein COT73_12735 [Bdellovibrio sp. CG10_big_fil_rev_8_21_14_0_10_47_8]
MTDKALLQSLVNRIRLFRRTNGLRQSDLAEKIHLTTRHLQKIEACSVDVKTSTSCQIAKALGIPVCYLYKPETEHPSGLKVPCAIEILDMIQVGILLADLDGRILYMNMPHLKTLGLTKDHLGQGIHVWDHLNDSSEIQSLKKLLQSLVSSPTKSAPYVTEQKTSSGEIIPVKTDWTYYADASRDIRYFVSVVHYYPN